MKTARKYQGQSKEGKKIDELLYKLFSALSQGAAFAFFTLGIGIAFRWIKFPDLTGDGSFTLGAVITTALISLGVPVWIAMPLAILSGFLAGVGTFSMYRYLKVPKILSGVLMTMALYTVNLRILGRPNVQVPRSESIFAVLPSTLGKEWAISMFVLLALIACIGFLILYTFLESRSGILLRAAGSNPKMAVINGISPLQIFWGLGLANGLIAFSGSLIAQRSYNADIHMGMGQVIVAVAALFVGMVIFRRTTTMHLLAASLTGSLLYMFLMQVALEIGVQAQDFRLISTLIVLVSIFLVSMRGGREALRRGADAFGIELNP